MFDVRMKIRDFKCSLFSSHSHSHYLRFWVTRPIRRKLFTRNERQQVKMWKENWKKKRQTKPRINMIDTFRLSHVQTLFENLSCKLLPLTEIGLERWTFKNWKLTWRMKRDKRERIIMPNNGHWFDSCDIGLLLYILFSEASVESWI